MPGMDKVLYLEAADTIAYQQSLDTPRAVECCSTLKAPVSTNGHAPPKMGRSLRREEEVERGIGIYETSLPMRETCRDALDAGITGVPRMGVAELLTGIKRQDMSPLPLAATFFR